MPLTLNRVKPAMPFGGSYRLIDFTLSNLVNGGVRDIVVLGRRGSTVLDRHIAGVWAGPSTPAHVETLAPFGRHEPAFAGSAAALLAAIRCQREPIGDHVFVFGADHVYQMDPEQLLSQHVASGADVTIATTRIPIAAASAFGVADVDDQHRVRRFIEKPLNPEPMPGDSSHVLASMGIYVFAVDALRRAVGVDGALRSSSRDVGRDVIPFLVSYGNARVFDFDRALVPGQSHRAYWRDIGTVDAYHRASMDLVADEPPFRLDNPSWPMRGAATPLETDGRLMVARTTMIPSSAVGRPATVSRSILGPGVEIEAGALVERSVLLPGVRIGPGAVVKNAIVDEGVTVHPGCAIGADASHDRARFEVTADGVTVVTELVPHTWRGTADPLATGQPASTDNAFRVGR